MINAPRILYIITKSELGGAQSHVLDLVTGFHPHYEVHLATGVHGPLTERAQASGVPVHILPRLVRSINPLTDTRAVAECAALLRQIKPDIMHAHSSKAGIVARFVGRWAGIPTIFTAHGWGFSPGTPSLRRLIALISERIAAPLTTKIICVSEYDRRLALRWGVGTPQSLVTIRYGIADAALPTAEPGIQPPRFVMVARFNEQKDQPTLLHALTYKQARDVHIDFVGSGPAFEQSQALAHALGVADRAVFLGDRHDVPALLAQAQAFVLSTHYEGLPISIMEALRAGLPVVATDVSGIAEEVVPGRTGLLVPYADPQALATALGTLFYDPELRQRLGSAAHQLFRQAFTRERMLHEIDGLYQQVLQQGKRRG